MQDGHGRFLAGKDAIVAVTSPARRCRRRFLFSQNPAKDQALAALPPVAAYENLLAFLLHSFLS